MKDRFVKVMLVIIAGLLLLNCNINFVSPTIREKQPNVKAVEILTNKIKERCNKDNLECRDFKVKAFYPSNPSQADEANGIVGKGGIEMSCIARLQTKEKWEDRLTLLEYKELNTGEIEISNLAFYPVWIQTN
jgi:hypothetical protein